jgi:hypothetical protein
MAHIKNIFPSKTSKSTNSANGLKSTSVSSFASTAYSAEKSTKTATPKDPMAVLDTGNMPVWLINVSFDSYHACIDLV